MVLTVNQRQQSINLSDQGYSQNKIASQLNISQSGVSKILNNRVNIENFNLNIDLGSTKRVFENVIQLRMIERKISCLVEEYNSINVPVNHFLIREIALKLAKEDGIENFVASNGWITEFKKRFQLSTRRICGESDAVNEEVVNKWLSDLPALIRGYDEEDIFNCDETALFYKQLPIYTVAKKNSEVHGKKIDKKRVTLHLCVNSKGKKEKILLINKVCRPRCFKAIDYNLKKLQDDYTNNEKGWMTLTIFDDWLRNWNKKLVENERKIILLLDNFSGHKTSNQYSNIQLLFFPASCTASLQPLDAGIINSFKTNYRSKLNQTLISHVDSNKSNEFLTEFNLLDAINLIQS